MARIFWMAFSYGFVAGMTFWINEKMIEKWRHAGQPTAR